MTDKFVINGDKPLNGEIEVRGSKNAAGPVLVATLLTEKECVIDILPLIEDIFNTIEVLKSIGAEVKWEGERKIKIKCEKINPNKIDFEKVSKTRISVLFFGALLSRCKNFKISHPGGDRIGLRPITLHLEAFKKLGAEILEEGDIYNISCKELQGTEIVLQEFSVTATENIILASVLANGKTIIKGASSEYQVRDLAKMLISMGAKIKGAGTHIIEIEGIKNLNGASHQVIFDPLEAGTFIAIGAACKGSIKVKNTNSEFLDLFFAKLEEMGVNLEKGEDYVIVSHSPNLKAVKVQALPYPGFPTDLLPIIIPLLIQANGTSLVHDPLYENRFNYIEELRKMGADINLVDPHRAFITGPTKLFGANISSNDIRAGACLVVAALTAEGETVIENVSQIDRGYEKIEERLQKLGADIKRISN